MINKLKSIFIIPELRQRILFTIGVLIVVRIGAHIPIPGVNGETLAEAFTDMKTGLFGLFNTFVGGAFEKASLRSCSLTLTLTTSGTTTGHCYQFLVVYLTILVCIFDVAF